METSRGLSEMDQSLGQLAQKLFLEFHAAIIEQESGAMEGDVEAIHAMRVAIRKLRVTLKNFSVLLSKEDRRRLQGYLERMADSLGKVRDLDVMIHSMKQALSASPIEDRPPIKALIARLRARRRRQQKNLIKYLQGEDYLNFILEASVLKLNSPKLLIGLSENGQAA